MKVTHAAYNQQEECWDIVTSKGISRVSYAAFKREYYEEVRLIDNYDGIIPKAMNHDEWVEWLNFSFNKPELLLRLEQIVNRIERRTEIVARLITHDEDMMVQERTFAEDNEHNQHIEAMQVALDHGINLFGQTQP